MFFTTTQIAHLFHQNNERDMRNAWHETSTYAEEETSSSCGLEFVLEPSLLLCFGWSSPGSKNKKNKSENMFPIKFSLGNNKNSHIL